jgi:hypothetical protein
MAAHAPQPNLDFDPGRRDCVAVRGPSLMPRPLKPTGVDPAYLRECLDVLSADPPVMRWRSRPLAHFPDEASLRHWGKTFAGQVIRPTADGRTRVYLAAAPGGERRSLDARSIVAEIGVTPIGSMQGVARGRTKRPARRDSRARRRWTASRRHAGRHVRNRAIDGRSHGHERRRGPL